MYIRNLHALAVGVSIRILKYYERGFFMTKNNNAKKEKKNTLEINDKDLKEFNDVYSLEDLSLELEDLNYSDMDIDENFEDYNCDKIKNSSEFYLNSLTQYKTLKPEETINLFKKIEDCKSEKEKKNYEEQIFIGNLKLVISFAKLYVTKVTSYDIQDLCQEGMLGLMKAIDRFDYKKGFTFSTYAIHWIRQAILRNVFAKDKMIRIPPHANQLCLKIWKMQAQGEEKSVKEYAKILNTSEELIKDALEMSNAIYSLDEPVKPEEPGDATLIDFVKDTNIPIEEKVVNGIMFEDLKNYMKKEFTLREYEIISLRFGFDGAPLTLSTVAKMYGLSRERIRQIEKKCLQKLKIAVRHRKIIDYRK